MRAAAEVAPSSAWVWLLAAGDGLMASTGCATSCGRGVPSITLLSGQLVLGGCLWEPAAAKQPDTREVPTTSPSRRWCCCRCHWRRSLEHGLVVPTRRSPQLAPLGQAAADHAEREGAALGHEKPASAGGGTA
jgi:hypothetical protein